MTSLLLEANSISVVFRARGRSVMAVDDITLSLGRGEVLGIVGESGSGKSTLALTLLNLLAPSKGIILLKGRPVGAMSRKAFARAVQPVFQDPYASLNPVRLIEDILIHPLAVHHIGTRSEQRETVHRVLDMVGLPRRLGARFPSELSGGQRQRVAIARALVLNPEVLICDEPTSALDVSVQAQILNLLLDLQRNLGISCVMISHNLAVIRYLSTNIMVMKSGKLVEYGSAAQIFERPQHAYTKHLLESILEVEPNGQRV